MKTKAFSVAVMTIAMVSFSVGCASRNTTTANAQDRADQQDINTPAETTFRPDPVLDVAPSDVPDVDTATKFDVILPNDKCNKTDSQVSDCEHQDWEEWGY